MYLSAVSASRCRTPRRGSRCGPARRGRCWTSARARRWSPGTGGRGASCATAPPSPPGSSIYRAPASCSDGGGCLRCIIYFVLFICTYFIHSTVSVNKRLSNGGEESGDGQRTSTGCCKTSGQFCKLLCDSFLGVFMLFLCSFGCQIWAIFHFGTTWA